jgi:hypothetical protein
MACATTARRAYQTHPSREQRVVMRAVSAVCVLRVSLTTPTAGGGREPSGGEHSGTELHDATWSINTLPPLPLAFVLPPARHSLMKRVTRRTGCSALRSRARRMPQGHLSKCHWRTCDLLICSLVSFVRCISVFPFASPAAGLALVHPAAVRPPCLPHPRCLLRLSMALLHRKG